MPPGVIAKNKLLEALPSQDRRHLLARCTQVELVLADVLIEPGERIRYAFFPTSGYISLITLLDGHAGLEVGLIGDEGMLGMSLMLGVGAAPLRALVQGPGTAWRMDVAAFRQECKRSPALQRILNRYVHVVMIQFAQAAACMRFHLVETRLARWLLMTGDRASGDEFYVTHEFLGRMLGVRRAGVTQAASALKDRKLIHYSRGNVTILDRHRLESIACKCYAAAKETYSSVLG
jgi:CRP-like cAMP-binding protein